jgi:hypothetical protein
VVWFRKLKSEGRGGLNTAEFVRQHLDQLGLGIELEEVGWTSTPKLWLLPVERARALPLACLLVLLVGKVLIVKVLFWPGQDQFFVILSPICNRVEDDATRKTQVGKDRGYLLTTKYIGNKNPNKA